MSHFGKWRKYRKKGITLMRPYVPGEDLAGIAANPNDEPKEGDMIACNPDKTQDQWLVNGEFFRKNYESEVTRTEDGTPIKIYEVYESYIHGAWQVPETGRWVMFQWYKDGSVWTLPFKKNLIEKLDLDFIDWWDEIPWEQLKDKIKWVARDENGTWFGYENKPTQSEIEWQASFDRDFHCCLLGVEMPAGPDDWREAIAGRPAGEGQK